MIAIIDCNSFYCSCERLFRPDLRDKPVAVLSNNDGCIISRSDEARHLGCHPSSSQRPHPPADQSGGRIGGSAV
ncbi:MAG TPA: hypothetical protein VGQ51_07400 [Puia sp.]|nr:hypothetical protein [Puia sp.]